MTSGSYAADTQAITSAAQAFEGQADPIAQVAQKLEAIKGTASNTGRDYGAQGSSYHDAVTKTLEALVREYSQKTSWSAGVLSQAAADYTASDAAASDHISTSGSRA